MALRAACLSHVPEVAVVGVRAVEGGLVRKNARPCDVAAPHLPARPARVRFAIGVGSGALDGTGTSAQTSVNASAAS